MIDPSCLPSLCRVGSVASLADWITENAVCIWCLRDFASCRFTSPKNWGRKSGCVIKSYTCFHRI